MTPGTYLIGVEKYDVTARYDLTLAATPYSGYTPAGDPGDRPLTARDLGNFSGTFTTKDYVGNLDGADYYKFSLNQTQNFNASFSAVPGDISMYLYRDANNNGFIDSGERVDYRYSDQASNISQILTSGVYFLSIGNYSVFGIGDMGTPMNI